MKNRILIITSVFVTVLLLTCGCSRKNKEADFDSYWYSCSSYNIPAEHGYQQSQCDNIYYDGNYYLTVYGSPIDPDDTRDDYFKLYKINSDTDEISCVELQPECFSYGSKVIIDDKLYSFNYSGEVFEIDIITGNIMNTRQSDEGVYGMYYFDSGYVEVSDLKTAVYYSADGDEVGRVDLNGTQAYCCARPFFERDGHFYFVATDGYIIIVYELDFLTNSYVEVAESNTLNNYIAGITGDLVFTDIGIYTYDFDNDSLTPVTEWSYVDVKPGYKKMISEENTSFGEKRFGKVYLYTDYDIELIVFKKEPAEKYENRTIIKIGGFGVSLSEPIRWAVFNFNTSQDEYRVVTEEYYESFDYSSGEEAQANTVELIQYFNSGNAPDIYYGFNFDYRYFYNSGMVIDMTSLIEQDEDIDLDDFVPSIRNTVTADGVCYQLFPAYSFNGDWGRREVFGDDEYTYEQIAEMALESGISVRGDCESPQIADQIIRCSMDELMRRSDGEHVLPLDVLTEIVEYSVTVGVPEGYVNSIADFDSVHEGLYMKCMSFMGNLYTLYGYENRLQDSFVYLGRPSVYGSAYIADPDGLVAISSDTQYTDACWQIIKELFSDEVQYIEVARGYNPVIESVMEDYCRYAADPESAAEDNELIRSIFSGKDPVPQWIIDDYMAMTSTIDTVITYDWGLYNMIRDEINSYDIQGKTPEDIAESLLSRLDLYVAENY